MEKIIIIGFGGHSHSVIDSIIQKKEYEIIGYVDNDEKPDYLGIKYLGNDSVFESIYKSGVHNACICVGFIGKKNNREELYDRLKRIGFKFPVIIDPSSIIASNVNIGEGTFVGKGAVINANAKIGKICIINSKSLIEHDCEIGDFSHISVSSCICGEVKIGNCTFVGANSTIIQTVKIGNNCVIGAGTLILKDIYDNTKVKLDINQINTNFN